LSLARYYHTLRHLKPIQVYGRIAFRYFHPKPDLSPAPPLRARAGPWIHPCEQAPSMEGPSRFVFLNVAREIDSARRWNETGWEKLWLYNLHYFDDLTARDAATRQFWHWPLLSRWVTENPPGYGTGWEPYPLSRRIVNWVKWALAGNEPAAEVRHSLAVQARFLRRRLETHLLGNHLLANAKALVFAGLFFSGDEADTWLSKGLEILERQIPEQILPDGGHFERSPMYHAIVFEDMLDLANIVSVYGQPLPTAWPSRIKSMQRWLKTMTHPDGNIAFFNDAAFGVAPDTSTLDIYSQTLGYASGTTTDDNTIFLPDSGYVRLVQGTAVVIADVAPVGPDYQPAHAHADTLSFELSLHGQRVLVNSGTSQYGSGPERERQRGTAAHNTVIIDRENSSDVWGGFRVARRARPFDVQVETDRRRVSAAHDGYIRLPGRPVHCRVWSLQKDALTITDRINGTGDHRIEVCFHMHPEVQAIWQAESSFLLTDRSQRVLATVTLSGMQEYSVEPTTHHPYFGVSLPCQKIVGRYQGGIPVELSAMISWPEGRAHTPRTRSTH
jgi:uncharacterized heparinase superfamily protein